MPESICEELALIRNLAAASDWHKEHCHESCGVSLMQLKQSARFTAKFMRVIGRRESEIEEAEKLIEGMTSI